MLYVMAAAATYFELPPVTSASLAGEELAYALGIAEQLVADGRYDDAVPHLEGLWDEVRSDVSLALRQRLALSWCALYRGELDRAGELLAHAELIVRSPHFDAGRRAEVLYRRGCVAFKRAEVAEATSLFTRALDLNDVAPQPRAMLSAEIYEWRSRCHQFRRDWDAAGLDAERALEIATAEGDELGQAHALFQASLVAERRKAWLVARYYAERALELYRKHGEMLAAARILNNLGGIDFLLGEVEEAERNLLAATETAAEAGSDADLAQAVNSLAQVYLATGRPLDARVRAQRAVELLTGRIDFRDELGNAQLIVARSLAAEGADELAMRWIEEAEQTFTELGSTSHLALAWVARADLVRELGDVDAAADLYRRAASSLQDVHF
jgi:tetratricopeptide (TPR) repeat protein